MKTELEGKLELMEHRLARLERQNSRLAGFAALSIVALVMTVAPGAAASKAVPKVLQAQRVEILDKDGRARITLGMDADGSATLRLLREKGDEAVVVAAGRVGDDGLFFLDHDGHSRLGLSSDFTDNVEVKSADYEGNPRAQLSLDESDMPALIFYEKVNTPSIALRMNLNGTRTFTMFDPAGQERIWLGVAADGAPEFQLKDQDGKILFQAPPGK